MANKHMKRCSTLLIIREMPIKSTMRYYLTPVRMAIIKESTNNTAGEGAQKRERSRTAGNTSRTVLAYCGNVNGYSHYVRWYGDPFKS